MTWTNQRNQALQERARRVIPNGMYGHMSTGLLPTDFPQYFDRGEGSRIWHVHAN